MAALYANIICSNQNLFHQALSNMFRFSSSYFYFYFFTILQI